MTPAELKGGIEVLVPSARLFEAMDTVDSSSGQQGGLLRLSK